MNFRKITSSVDSVLGGFPTRNATTVNVSSKCIPSGNAKFSLGLGGENPTLKSFTVNTKTSFEDWKFDLSGSVKGNDLFGGMYSISNSSLLKGLKFTENFELNANEFAKSNTTFKVAYSNSDVGCHGSVKKALTDGSPFNADFALAGKYSQFLLGVQGKMKVVDLKTPLSFSGIDVAGGATYNSCYVYALLKSVKTLKVGASYKVDGKTSVACDYLHDLKADGKKPLKRDVTAGISHKINDKTSAKVKLDSNKNFGVSFSQKFDDKKLGISFQTNLSSLAKSFKCTLNFDVNV